MTIDVRRDEEMESGRHACDDLAADMERFYRKRPDIRFDVTLSLHLLRPRAVSLVYVRTLNRRRGLSSIVMDELCAAADRHEVTLDLDARAVRDDATGPAGLAQADLERFYERRGFRICSRRNGSVTMRRLAPMLSRTPPRR